MPVPGSIRQRADADGCVARVRGRDIDDRTRAGNIRANLKAITRRTRYRRPAKFRHPQRRIGSDRGRSSVGGREWGGHIHGVNRQLREGSKQQAAQSQNQKDEQTNIPEPGGGGKKSNFESRAITKLPAVTAKRKRSEASLLTGVETLRRF